MFSFWDINRENLIISVKFRQLIIIFVSSSTSFLWSPIWRLLRIESPVRQFSRHGTLSGRSLEGCCSLYRWGIYFQNSFFFFLIFNFLFPGHGFKMLVGNALSQLVVSEKMKYDMLPVRLSRFSGFKELKSSRMMLQQHTELEYNHGINK